MKRPSVFLSLILLGSWTVAVGGQGQKSQPADQKSQPAAAKPQSTSEKAHPEIELLKTLIPKSALERRVTWGRAATPR